METARRRNGPPQPTAGFPSQTTRRRADARRRSRSSIVAWTSRHSRWSALLIAGCAAAFAPRAAPPRHRPAPTCTEPLSPRTRHRPATQLNCICVNCAFVDNCTAYHVVEAKHGQPHVSQDPIFTPREGSPTVAVNIFPPDSVNKAKVKKFDSRLDEPPVAVERSAGRRLRRGLCAPCRAAAHET